MNKEELYNQAYKLLFEDSGELQRDEFKDLLYEIKEACENMIDAMNDEDTD